MANNQIFQFTLGPVQGFVAQARRTRDFWAGSFILSWLASTAIACIQKQGGKIQFPVPDEAYLQFLYGNTEKQDIPRPQQGSIPNRFMATTAEVPHDFKPQWVTQSVQRAWLELARIVWVNDGLEAQANQATRAIWDRQINNFWEISWVLSDGLDPTLLDKRKNWRGFVPPNEPGHKCMMMDGWQELSGITKTDMKAVNSFWEKLSQNGNAGISKDLREGEQLCAMAFIKRRFARYFQEVKVELPGNLGHVHGWQVPGAVPSVAFLAAAPWLAKVIETAPIEAFQAFHNEAKTISGYDEAAHVQGDQAFAIDIRCVRDAAEKRQQQGDGFRRIWAGLDGQVYFPTALENPRLFDDKPAAKRVLRQLRQLRDAAGITDLPSPYYAILLMDGDQLGKHMGDKDKQKPISNALNAFTREAGNIVREHNGFLVYAGGDDVLALLPLDDALPAAAALQASYKAKFEQESLKDNSKEIKSTLSGAIEFVHFRTPLTRVLQDAHQLLDDVAKDQTGRDAIAVRVWKPSGLALQWAMPWDKALDGNGKVKIAELATEFANRQAQQEGGRFSNKFFFRLQQVIERFPTASHDILEKLIYAEYIHSYGSQGNNASGERRQAIETRLNALLDQCRPWQRKEPDLSTVQNADQPLNPDAALLVRFLAQKGLERDSQ